ncbi:hypothetical protein O3M35_013157 [Rhynocoris fuscipes]|uniref:Cytochrome P450 n=1 Tax=Rhynocoris fuscipes TaxID=488301 RepID=A0AAW1CES3_9HEMI
MIPIFVALIAIILSLLAYFTYQAYEATKYWKRRGIVHKKPKLFFGNWPLQSWANRKSFGEILVDYLKDFPDEPFVGFNDFTKPRLLITDVDLIEKILIKDFNHFVDHGFNVNKDAIDINLFTMKGKEWRSLRYKLSPLFTTTKLKTMYEPMAECSQSLTSILDKMDESEDVDMKEYISCFAMDVIGSCAYGIDAKNLSQPDNEFRKMGKKSFDFGAMQVVRMIILNLFPFLAKLLNITFNKREVGDYFCKVIRDTIDYRKKNGIARNDILQMFMTLKEKGSIEMHTKDPDDDYLKIEKSNSPETFEFTDDMMIGHAFSFLNAGFEGTAVSALLTLYELSQYSDIQDRVRHEIQKHVEEAGGTLTYDALKKMTYLEQCVKETLRKHSLVVVLDRVCTKEYTLPNGYQLPVGANLFIVVQAVHNNPRIYPEPEKFRPEHFDPDLKLPSCSFLTFGNGPRICIAMRFALLEIKHCIAKLLMNHEYKLSPNTKPFRIDVNSAFNAPKDPLLFNIRKIKDSK